jgi:hypothetical protein
MDDAGNPAHLKDGRRHRNLHQRDKGSGDSDGRCRVHHNAQWAVVGICIRRVRMRDLNKGQQGQQGQTYQRNHDGTGPFVVTL